MLFKRGTSKIRSDGESVADLYKVRLGGIDQWILARGASKANPVLLVLHGGPGSSQIGFAPSYQENLEKRFIVVNWDQRGSGMNYSGKVSKDSMNVDQFISDAVELASHLIKAFDKNRIFLMGHSWGSALGVLTAKRHPELFHAFLGVGQAVNFRENEDLAYMYVLECARNQKDKIAVKILERFGNPRCSGALLGALIRMKYGYRYGRGINSGITKSALVKKMFFSREYNLLDFFRFLAGYIFTISLMISGIMEIDLFSEVASLEIPAYFILGRYDHITPTGLAKKFYDDLEAPHKELIWFENSAHDMPFEDPELFQKTVIEKLLRGDIISMKDNY